jgi:dienelactone hydrolase family protein
VEQLRELEQALGENGIENEIYIYNDVGHAFANPSSKLCAGGSNGCVAKDSVVL